MTQEWETTNWMRISGFTSILCVCVCAPRLSQTSAIKIKKRRFNRIIRMLLMEIGREIDVLRCIYFSRLNIDSYATLPIALVVRTYIKAVVDFSHSNRIHNKHWDAIKSISFATKYTFQLINAENNFVNSSNMKREYLEEEKKLFFQ